MNPIRFARAIARVALAGVVALGCSGAWALNGPVVLDFLAGTDGFRISQTGLAHFADAVAILPDLNGDGLGEIAVAAPADLAEAKVYVLFGRAGASAPVIDVAQIDGSNGFRVLGLANGELGAAVHSAGDFNGDGRKDLLLMTRGSDRAYIVLGRSPWPATIDLSRAPTGVVELVNPSGIVGLNDEPFGTPPMRGTATGPGADYNGDGYADVAIMKNNAINGRTCSVVFGRGVIAGQVNLDALNGTNGFTLAKGVLAEGGIDGCSMVGDVNGDGLADLVASNYRDPNLAGSVFVLLGQTANPAVVLTSAAIPPRGFRIGGPAAGANFDPTLFGQILKTAGDLNNDGLADLALGTYMLGSVHVVFGRRVLGSPLSADALDGTNGYRITAGSGGRVSGHIAASGDVDGDGIGDLLLGVSQAGTAPGARAWVQFGRNGGFAASTTTSAFIDDIGVQNTLLQGTINDDVFNVGAGADVNGDGLGDYVVGRVSGDTQFALGGTAYVVFGRAGRLVCRTTSATIPDNNATGITRGIALGANAPLALIEPFVNISHTWVGDLTAWLSSPAGATIPLVDRPGHNAPPPFPPSIGLCAADNMVLTLADNAATSVDLDCSRSDVAGTPAYAGARYRPTQAVSAFNGQAIAGTWQLRVADNGVQDVGTLTRWCLGYYPQVVAPPLSDLVLRNGFE